MSGPGSDVAVANPVRPSSDLVVAPPPPPLPERVADDSRFVDYVVVTEQLVQVVQMQMLVIMV